MNIAMVEKPVLSAHAWRVTFKAPTTEADFGSLVPDAPRPLVAMREEFNVTDALDALPPKPESTEFMVIWAPPGATTVEHSVESWVGAPSPPLRASISTIRVLWSNNRAVLFCAAEPFESGYDAVVRFTAIMREVRSLDEQMADVWRSVNKHVHLVHASLPRNKRKEVNRAYEKAVELKLMFLRTQTLLEQLNAKLDSTSKRLCAEMILAANLHDRLELMEDLSNSPTTTMKSSTRDCLKAKTPREGCGSRASLPSLLPRTRARSGGAAKGKIPNWIEASAFPTRPPP